jgi:hypothetical protein
MLTAMVVVAMLCAVGSLVFGIAAMASDGEVRHLGSADWMGLRVSFQALAFALILMALIA